MSAQAFLSAISQVAFLTLFAISTVRLARRFSLAALDTFAFFGVIAVLLLAGDVERLLGLDEPQVLATITWVAVTALPYLLLRLADDFRPQPRVVTIGAAAAYLVVALIGILAPQPYGPGVSLISVAFVVILGLYASLAFMREAMRTAGVTQRRMQAVAIGSGLLAAVLLLNGVRVVWPSTADLVAVVSQTLGIILAFSYFMGFAPPRFVRRAWQEPALRSMLTSSPDLVRLPDASDVVSHFERQAEAATGAEGARLGLWDGAAGVLRFGDHPLGQRQIRPGEFVSGRAFDQQRTIFTTNPERDAPEHAHAYRETGIQAVVSTPVTSADHHLGVLTVYAARPPAFTEDVIRVIELVAEQVALVLRSRQLLAEASHVRALAEVTRLKNDFLSVVAHDVRTPLTAILLNVEMLQRQSAAQPDAIDRRLSSLRTEALRLRDLVEDYLGLVRAEEDRDLDLEELDLATLVREMVERAPAADGRVHLSGDGSLPGRFDRRRVGQLVQNLVGNALKYSDDEVDVEVRRHGSNAVMTVHDRGIGIPEADLPRLFERFHRGTNTDDRRHSGMGLGLYISRKIAEAHGGSITVSSRMNEGSRFEVRLPLGVSAGTPEPMVETT